MTAKLNYRPPAHEKDALTTRDRFYYSICFNSIIIT